jgi:hypothetical protein
MNIKPFNGHDPRRYLEQVKECGLGRLASPSIKEWTHAQLVKNCETGLPFSASLGVKACAAN